MHCKAPLAGQNPGMHCQAPLTGQNPGMHCQAPLTRQNPGMFLLQDRTLTCRLKFSIAISAVLEDIAAMALVNSANPVDSPFFFPHGNCKQLCHIFQERNWLKPSLSRRRWRQIWRWRKRGSQTCVSIVLPSVKCLLHHGMGNG